MAGRCRRVKHPPKLQPFDLTRYLGSEERGVPPPYTSAEIIVLSVGALGLLAALEVPGPQGICAAARAVSRSNRRRFYLRAR